MTTLHSKSSCCGAEIVGHGGRRNKCTGCGKTWRKYKHKQGRKKKRINKNILKKIILENQSIKFQLNHYPNLNLRSLQKRIQSFIRSAASKPNKYPILRGRYILIADGLWYRFNGEDYVLYLLALKPRRRNYMYLLDPVMLPGRERFNNWKIAIETIPENIRKRIVAFVSDDFRASGKIVRHFNLIHQLCHFHLIAELQKRRGRRKYRIGGKSIREEVYQLIRKIIEETDRKTSIAYIRRLKQLINYKDCPNKIRGIARELIRNLQKYHAHLKYPEYTIPRTTSAVESLGNLIRERTNKLNNPQSVHEWATVFMRLKKKIICNGQKTIEKSKKS